MQPAFSPTSLSPYGLASEPSSFQEIPFRKNLLQDAYTAITPPPSTPPSSQEAFDIWTMGIAQAVSFPCYFIFAKPSASYCCLFTYKPQHEETQSFASSSICTRLFYFSFSLSFVLFPFSFVFLSLKLPLLNCCELAKDDHFCAFFL